MKADKLQKLMLPRFLEVLFEVIDTPGAPRSNVYVNVSGSNPTLKNRIDELNELGLIRIKRMDKRPFAELLYPTEKGKRIAELALEMESVFQE